MQMEEKLCKQSILPVFSWQGNPHVLSDHQTLKQKSFPEIQASVPGLTWPHISVRNNKKKHQACDEVPYLERN